MTSAGATGPPQLARKHLAPTKTTRPSLKLTIRSIARTLSLYGSQPTLATISPSWRWLIRRVLHKLVTFVIVIQVISPTSRCILPVSPHLESVSLRFISSSGSAATTVVASIESLGMTSLMRSSRWRVNAKTENQLTMHRFMKSLISFMKKTRM